MRRLPLLVALGVLLLAPAGPLHAAVYQWTDANGTPHFTDRPEDVPPAYREQLPPELRSAAAATPKGPEQRSKPGFLSRALSAAHAAEARHDHAPARARASKLASLRHLGLGALLAVALATVAFSFLFYAFLLRLACRICSEEVPRFSRALAVTGVQLVAGIGLGVLELAVLGFSGGAPSPLVRGINSLLGFGLNVAVLRAMLGQTLGKALAVQGVSMLIGIVLVIVVIAVFAMGFGGMALLHGGG